MNAFDLALNYLTYKPRTEKEIRDYLRKKKIRKEIIEDTVIKLKEYNYINDSDYVIMYLKNNDFSKQFGLNKISYELNKRGIKKEELDILEVIPEEVLENYCNKHFKKILAQTENLPYKKRIPKIVRYLNSKGFDYAYYSSLINKIPKESKINDLNFKKDLEHYLKLYSKKNYKDFELKNRVIKGLLSKGYSYDYINESLSNIDLMDC